MTTRHTYEFSSTDNYPNWVDEAEAEIRRRADAVPPVTSSFPGIDGEALASLDAAVQQLRPVLLELSHQIHRAPEVAFEEYQATDLISSILREHRSEVEIGICGLPTALRASAGDSRPRVAVLAEYDALPELGHACGHNLIAAISVGAYLAAATVLDATRLEGSISLIGSPAEEGGGGKAILIERGAFASIDAALMVHPANFDAPAHRWLGRRQVRVTYTGLPAHAAAAPHQGRNALDAAVLAYTGVSQLRQHILPQERIHGILLTGGVKPNVVPSQASSVYYLRSSSPTGLESLSRRAESIFVGSARSTGTDVELLWDETPIQLPMNHNDQLSSRYAVHMSARGRTVLPRGTVPTEYFIASTDMGNVSWKVPSIHPTVGIAPLSVPLHTPAFAQAAISAVADDAIVDAAFSLAATALDFLADRALRDASGNEFSTQRSGAYPTIASRA